MGRRSWMRHIANTVERMADLKQISFFNNKKKIRVCVYYQPSESGNKELKYDVDELLFEKLVRSSVVREIWL